MLQGLSADPEGSGQATLAGSPSAGGSSWAALADSALPQGPLLEEAASADVRVSFKTLYLTQLVLLAAIPSYTCSLPHHHHTGTCWSSRLCQYSLLLTE